MSLIAICLSLSFRLLQNQTARTSSFLLQGKMLWCFRRRHRKVSHLGSFSCPLLSFLFSPLVPLTDPTPSPFHLCPLCPFIFILSYPAIPVFLCPIVFSVSPFTSLLRSFRLIIVCSLSVWNAFRLRCVQVPPSCCLTSHFTGSFIMY